MLKEKTIKYYVARETFFTEMLSFTEFDFIT